MDTNLKFLTKSLKSKYKDLVFGVIIEPNKSKVSEGNTDGLSYLASTAKICWIIAALKILERGKMSLKEKNIPIHINEDLLKEMYEEKFVVEAKTNKPKYGDPLIGKVLFPMMGKGLIPEKALELLNRALEKLREQPEKNDELLKVAVEELSFCDNGSLNMSEVVKVILGPSSNEAVLLLKNWIVGETNSEAADFVQNTTDQLLEPILEGKTSKIAITGSSKAKKVGYWNCGSLEEIFYIFKLVADGSESLDLSKESIDLMRKSMEDTADNEIELGVSLKGNEQVKKVFGKSGFYPDMKTSWQPTLVKQMGWEAYEYMMFVLSLERVIFHNDNGGVTDISYSLGLPFNSDKDALDDDISSYKKELSGIIIKSLIDYVLT